MDELLDSVHLSESAYERVLNISIGTAVVSVEQLADALGCDDVIKVKGIGHDLKGMFGNLRLETLTQLAERIEREAESGKVSYSIWKLYEELLAKVNALKEVTKNRGG